MSRALKIAVVTTCLVLVQALLVSISFAAVPARPAADGEPPPRPPLASESSGAPLAVGEDLAWITLYAGPVYAALSSEVQWQDGNGRWHAVEGWRAPVDTGVITWSVLKHDFGAGPFRWVLYETLAGRPVAASQPFDLPPAGGEAVRVYIQLAYVPTPFGLQPGVKMTAVDYCWWNCQPQ